MLGMDRWRWHQTLTLCQGGEAVRCLVEEIESMCSASCYYRRTRWNHCIIHVHNTACASLKCSQPLGRVGDQGVVRRWRRAKGEQERDDHNDSSIFDAESCTNTGSHRHQRVRY